MKDAKETDLYWSVGRKEWLLIGQDRIGYVQGNHLHYPNVIRLATPKPVSADDDVRSSDMTLRDWFAGMALSGMMSDPEFRGSARMMAGWCFEYADAMLKARKAATTTAEND